MLIGSFIFSTLSAMALILYRDIVRRLDKLERKTAASLMALLLVMGKLGDVPADLLRTIHEALTNGK